MRKTIPMGPWPYGIDQVSHEERLLTDEKGEVRALRDAVNVDVDRTGRVARCSGWALIAAQAGLRALWVSPLGAFAAAGTTLFRVRAGALEPIAALNSADPCSFEVFADAVIVSNRTTLLAIRSDGVQPVGVSDGSLAQAVSGSGGGLRGGDYGVAVAYLRGDYEGGLSPVRFVSVPDNGGITISGIPSPPDATAVRVYRTHAGGTVLFHAADIPIGMPSYDLGGEQLGKEARTQWLRQMLPGDYAAAWRGRLLVARGRNLFMSQPMNPGLYSPRHGFVQFPQRIRLIAPVEVGVFIGTSYGVVLLRGDKPGDWRFETTGAKPPVAGSYTPIDGAELDASLQLAGQTHAMWLAPNGFVIGTNDGRIEEPQKNRINAVAAQFARTSISQRRVTASLVV